VYCAHQDSRVNEPGEWLDGEAQASIRQGHCSRKESTGIRRTGLSANETNELINKAWQSAKQLVDKRRDAIKEVASELEKNGYIEGDAVRAIVEKGS